MSYQIIARKYRPLNFKEIIGQEKTTTILKHSVDRNKIGHAYLFSGPRGVGKTTLARILVKCLNCDRGTSSHPCDQCPTCQGIQQGVSLDYEEIDGASNRGIDHIREIKNNLGYSSPRGKHRIFVIDEVHMLTIEAFNALLKSLEEPPPKTIFILCTTEKHKIPMTIRSRCQQFQFDRVAPTLIEKHLKKILDLEAIGYQENSLFPIAKKADGSVRDAENLLEQAIAYSPEGLTLEKVTEILGELASEKKIGFIHHLLNNKLKENQSLIHQLSVEGTNFEQFLFDLNEIFTAIIYYKAGIKERKILEISDEDWQQIISLSDRFTQHELFLLTDLIYDFIKELKNTTYERLSIYYFLIKIHRYSHLISTEELKENITHLAKYYLKADDDLVPELDPLNGKEASPKNKNASNNLPHKPTPPKTPHPKPAPELSATEQGQQNYDLFVKSLVEKDQPLYHLLLTFDFEEIKDQTLVLYNRDNQDENKLWNLKTNLLTYLNQSKFFNRMTFNEVELKENIFQHNTKIIQDTLKMREDRQE